MPSFIKEYKNFLPNDYCDQLIEKFEKDPNTHVGRTGAGVDATKKDSIDCTISNYDRWQKDCGKIASSILQATLDYAREFPFLLTGAISPSIQDPKTGKSRSITHSDISQLSNSQLEGMIKMIFGLDSINMQRYTKGKGGYHHWHSEHYPHPTDPAQKSLHRVLLWLVYLNDVDEGGETEFYYQKRNIRPSKGSLVLAPVNFTYTHRGAIPVSNDKYVLASWLLYNPANQLYKQPKQ